MDFLCDHWKLASFITRYHTILNNTERQLHWQATKVILRMNWVQEVAVQQRQKVAWAPRMQWPRAEKNKLKQNWMYSFKIDLYSWLQRSAFIACSTGTVEFSLSLSHHATTSLLPNLGVIGAFSDLWSLKKQEGSEKYSHATQLCNLAFFLFWQRQPWCNPLWLTGLKAPTN